MGFAEPENRNLETEIQECQIPYPRAPIPKESNAGTAVEMHPSDKQDR